MPDGLDSAVLECEIEKLQCVSALRKQREVQIDMVMVDRRGFLGGALALVGAGGCRSLGIVAEKPNLVFGVISDVHVTTPESTGVFVRTLKYFRDRKVDAVMISGDLTDWGLKSSLRYLADAWRSVFPDDRAPDGRRVERIFCTGNHDYEGFRYSDMAFDMQVRGYSDDEALSKQGMKKCWEDIFNEPFAAVRRRTVKGYDFISAEWSEGRPWNEAADEWFAQNGMTLDPKKPFFFFTHFPLGGTTSCSKPKAATVKALKSMPNAVAFSGHRHWTLNDERSIWQGEFTAIAVPSLSYSRMPNGYENGYDSRDGNPKASMQKIPSRARLEEAQGFLVSVFDDRMEIERRDFTYGVEAAPAWIVTPPTENNRPFAFGNRIKRSPVPQFPAGASLKTRIANSEDRNGCWAIMVMLDFPSAKAVKGRVYDYEVRVETEDGTVPAVKRFLSPAFYKLERDEPAFQSFAFNAKDLPKAGKYRFRVYPRNCFGICGRPIESKVFESAPAKDRGPKKPKV